MTLFVLISAIYVFCLALIDALFNRLIFREIKKLPYAAKEKQIIYKNWEWQGIGLILLVILPMVLPSLVSYLVGGWKYLGIYWVIFLTIQWDVIFGKLVFDDWWGDTPSIALPFIGWRQFNLKRVVWSRLILALIISCSLWLGG